MRFQIDDIIRLRLSAQPALVREMKEWVKHPRDYNTEFHARVKRILAHEEG
jgi:hypothetical protein